MFSDLFLLQNETLGDPDICVALLDGPVDIAHSSFQNSKLKILQHEKATHKGEALQHGTQIASIVFDKNTGIAPSCSGIIIPIFQDREDGSIQFCSQTKLAKAIQQAIQEKANIINISGGQFEEQEEIHSSLQEAIQHCKERNVLVIAAAGNNGCECPWIPANMPEILVVGAMNFDGEPLEFSNWGGLYQEQGILALGKDILTAIPDEEYKKATGTSYATAIVSGVVALFLSIQKKIGQEANPYYIRDIILESAINCNLKPSSNCQRLLAGRLNIPGALKLLLKGDKKFMSDINPSKPTNEEIFSEISSAVVNPISKPENKANKTDFNLAPATCDSCAEKSKNHPQLVYALGKINYDFGFEARYDSFMQLSGITNPRNSLEVVAFLKKNTPYSESLIWTLCQDISTIYAIKPIGPFGFEIYKQLIDFLESQIKEGAERVSIPGIITGQIRLMNGQIVPVIAPDFRGMFCWSTKKLITCVLGDTPKKSEKKKFEEYELKEKEICNFLDRIYYEIRNLGKTPQERAINFAATNAYQAQNIYSSAIHENLKLDKIDVEKSPFSRPDSDCWDVKLTFFDPENRLQRSRVVYRFTVDVSDIVPVMVGEVRHWHIY